MSNFAKYLMAAVGNTSSEEGVVYKDVDQYSHVRFDTMNAAGVNVTGVFVHPDGTKFYHLAGVLLKEMNLSTAFNISTHGSAVNTVNITSHHGGNSLPSGIFFKPDGTKLFITDNDDTLYAYSLSTAWDISTISSDGSKSLTGPFNLFRGPYFSPDGTKFFGIDPNLDRVKGFNLTTAWDISTIGSVVSTSSLLDISSTINEANPRGFWMSDDGTKAYIVGAGKDRIYHFDLSTAWDVSLINGPADSFLSISSYETTPNAICFSPDGKHIYIGGAVGDGVDQFSRS